MDYRMRRFLLIGAITIAPVCAWAAYNEPSVGSVQLVQLGTNVLNALGNAVGSVGAFIVNGGPAGTPSSIILTNGTGLPVSTGLQGVATGVPAALAIAPNTTGGFATFPTSGSGVTLGFPQTVGGATTSGGIPFFASATSLASSAVLVANNIIIGGGAGVAPSTTTTGSGILAALAIAPNTGAGALVTQQDALQSGAVLLGGGNGASVTSTTTGTGVINALGVSVGTAGAFVVNGGSIGTPSGGVLTNETGLPVAGITPAANGANGLLQLNSSGFIPTTPQVGTIHAGTHAAAGNIGEDIVADVPVSSAVPMTSGVVATIATITLTPGDYDCWGSVVANPAATTTITEVVAGLNPPSGSMLGGAAEFTTLLPYTAPVGVQVASPVPSTVIIDTGSPSPVSLLADVFFTTSTLNAFGRIECRRAR
jgi:hypothetical protein